MINFDEIDLAFWIPSQVFAFFALVAIIYAMIFTKTKTQTLFAIIAFNIFIVISTALLSNWIITGISALAVARDIVFLWREKYYPGNRRISYATLFIFLALSIGIAVGLTIDWNLPTLELALALGIQVMALFIIYGAWAKGVHLIRISRFFYCSLVLINHIIFYNYIAIIIEAFAMIAIIVWYYRRLVVYRERNTTTQDLQESHQS